MTPLSTALIPVSPNVPGYLAGPAGQAYQENHIRLLLTKDPLRSVSCRHRMTFTSASVCLPGLSSHPLSGYALFPGFTHMLGGVTLFLVPQTTTQTCLFNLGMYQPGASPTDYTMSKNENKAYLCGCMVKHTLFDMSVLIRIWRTALPAFTLHRKVTAIQAIGLRAVM